MKLDPKTNAKLKIELSKVPDGTPFTVEMNRKVLLNGVAGKKETFENAYVPPGVQEFRVVIRAAGERKGIEHRQRRVQGEEAQDAEDRARTARVRRSPRAPCAGVFGPEVRAVKMEGIGRDGQI